MMEISFRFQSRAAILFVILGGWLSLGAFLDSLCAADDPPRTIEQIVRETRGRIVKLFGAGGFRGLEAYQTGVLISESGHVLTAWSHVLDADPVVAFLDDGRRFEARLLGYDPRLEIAVLKLDVEGLDFFDLEQAVVPQPGELVLAFTNLYGVATGNEPVSVQHGSVTAVRSLEGDRIGGRLAYRGPVLMVDAITSNPGTPGGAIVDSTGRLVGIIGKDLKAPEADVWLNYALPLVELRRSIDDILSGKLVVASEDDSRPLPSEPLTLELLGLELVADVLGKTPPFVDRVVSGGPADRGGIQADDLVLFVDDSLVSSRRDLETALRRVHRDDPVTLTLQRGSETLTVELEARP